MTYLNAIAAQIEQRVPHDLLPEGDAGLLFRLYAVLALAKGADVEAVDVHNAWAAWMQERDPSHESIRPFEELSPLTQAADYPFVEAIRAVASERARMTGEPRPEKRRKWPGTTHHET